MKMGGDKVFNFLVKMQNTSFMIHKNSFQSSNFVFVYFSLLTFKFIQLSLFHQLLLYVMINFPIFKIFFQIFLIKEFN